MPAGPPLAHGRGDVAGIGGQVGGKRSISRGASSSISPAASLASLAADAKVEPVVTLSRGTAELVSARPLASINGWRAMFDVRPPDASTQPIDMRLFLRSGERALTETWIYQWAPGPWRLEEPQVLDRGCAGTTEEWGFVGRHHSRFDGPRPPRATSPARGRGLAVRGTRAGKPRVALTWANARRSDLPLSRRGGGG